MTVFLLMIYLWLPLHNNPKPPNGLLMDLGYESHQISTNSHSGIQELTPIALASLPN